MDEGIMQDAAHAPWGTLTVVLSAEVCVYTTNGALNTAFFSEWWYSPDFILFQEIDDHLMVVGKESSFS